jgi:hypothetical protein
MEHIDPNNPQPGPPDFSSFNKILRRPGGRERRKKGPSIAEPRPNLQGSLHYPNDLRAPTQFLCSSCTSNSPSTRVSSTSIAMDNIMTNLTTIPTTIPTTSRTTSWTTSRTVGSASKIIGSASQTVGTASETVRSASQRAGIASQPSNLCGKCQRIKP